MAEDRWTPFDGKRGERRRAIGERLFGPERERTEPKDVVDESWLRSAFDARRARRRRVIVVDSETGEEL